MKPFLRLLVLLLIFSGGPAAFAVNPDEMLADPALEARARVISENLRCLVCQNQSIDDSNADLARELRILVRERLKAGDDDAAAMQYIVDRYGEFVLLRPTFSAHNLLLWAAAPLILVIGAGMLFLKVRRRPRAEADPTLDDEEAKALERLEDGGGQA